MIYQFQGNYTYSKEVVGGWNSSAIGVYYCGYKVSNGNLRPLYIGRAIGDGGIRGRLLQHLSEDKWPDVTIFGYTQCSTAQEAIDLESKEIAIYKPKYNEQGK